MKINFRKLLPFFPLLAIVHCNKEADVKPVDFQDVTYEYSYRYVGTSYGATVYGCCTKGLEYQSLYLKFGSDGILTTLLIANAWRDCNPAEDESWTDYPWFCKTMPYSLTQTESDSEDHARFIVDVGHTDYCLFSGETNEDCSFPDFFEVSDYSVPAPYINSVHVEADTGGSDTRYPFSIMDAFDWSQYECVPETFNVIDAETYAPSGWVDGCN
jgi:hypothetical protein